ncbi:pentatricopeptide repeat-containing protein At3g24000, mitochondrial-like [Coffea eugenioides]|uniref:Pentatricopeptide repeat-containing protein At5g52630 n=1 Tax=Coffea arabica TaxID=13443 RepID=A0A6P6SX71_COFAR|nr:pentatricopeptide repeat-containing protein At3g24000, mitochondrial-like [Coffea eugenioides]
MNLMATTWKMIVGNSPLCSFACNKKEPLEPQRIKKFGIEHLRFRNDFKLLDKITQRINVSVSGSGMTRPVNGSEMGVIEDTDFELISGIIYDACKEQGVNAMPGLLCWEWNLTDKKNIVDQLSYCSREGNLGVGKIFHALVIKTGFCGDKIVDTALVNMYAKCGEIGSAVKVFDGMLSIDVASYNCLISGFLSNEMFDEALGLFAQMGVWEIRPNHYTFSIMISGCGSVFAINEGIQLHAHVVKLQDVVNGVVANSLLTMYCKFGMMENAQSLFQSLPKKNVVSWTAIISGLYQQRALEKALLQFYLMRQHGFEPNEYTLTMALSSCGGIKQFDNGYALHAQLVKKGMASGAFVGTAIVDMYTELGQMDNAEKQLQEMGTIASAVSWNALIAGFVHNNNIEAALKAFHKMVLNYVPIDEYTFSNALKACSSLPSLSTSRQIHCWVIKASSERNLHVASSLIEVYGKCGSLDDAEKVFDQISMPDIVSWNCLVKAYSQHGYFEKAVSLFKKMVVEGVKPSGSTFLAVLSACSHCGLVQEGKEFFKSMLMNYSVIPEETHYCCMVDLFSRSGHLEDALDFIKRLPIKPTAPIWRPLLAGCRCHCDLQLGEYVANRILELEPDDASVHVTLSNMYFDVGRLGELVKQRELMKLKEVKKEPGYSWIEVKNKTYKFFSGDTTHPQTPEVYDLLEKLINDIRVVNHASTLSEISTPHTELGLCNEGKLLYHSEKLAVCFGLLNLPAGTPIRIFKNIRVCSDCHTTMKHISKITKHEILLRDNYRFHHFKQGCCSCGDFW